MYDCNYDLNGLEIMNGDFIQTEDGTVHRVVPMVAPGEYCTASGIPLVNLGTFVLIEDKLKIEYFTSIFAVVSQSTIEEYYNSPRDTAESSEDCSQEAEVPGDIQSVLHNNHYAQGGLHQPIETMQSNMSKEAMIGYLQGNIIKYCCRLGKKDREEKEVDKIYVYAKWLREVVQGRTIDPREDV